jgi:hypothetical protein
MWHEGCQFPLNGPADSRPRSRVHRVNHSDELIVAGPVRNRANRCPQAYPQNSDSIPQTVHTSRHDANSQAISGASPLSALTVGIGREPWLLAMFGAPRWLGKPIGRLFSMRERIGAKLELDNERA